MDNSRAAVELAADLGHVPARARALVVRASVAGAIGPTQDALNRAACAVIPKSGQCTGTGGRFCVYALLMQERYCTVTPSHTCGLNECRTDSLPLDYAD